ASASVDGIVQLWDRAGGHEQGEPIKMSTSDIRVAFSPDGKMLAVLPVGSTAETLKLLDRTTRRELDVLALVPGEARAMTFAPYGRFLATAGGPVNLWGLGAQQPVRTFKGRTGLIRSLAISPEGSTIATAGGDGGVTLWDVARGDVLAELKGHTRAV